MMKTYTTQWCVFDVLNEQSIGCWTDISAAKEFMYDNETSEDCWTLMPALDTYETVVNSY